MCRTTSLVVPLSVYVGFHVRGGAAPCHVQWPTGASLDVSDQPRTPARFGPCAISLRWTLNNYRLKAVDS